MWIVLRRGNRLRTALAAQFTVSLAVRLAIRLVTALPIVILTGRSILSTHGVPMFGDLNFPLTLRGYEANFANMWNPRGPQSNLQSIDRLLFIQPIVLLQLAANVHSTVLLSRLLLVGLPLLAGQTALSLARKVALIVTGTSHTRVAALTSIAFAWLFQLSPWVMYRESAYFYLLSYAVAPLVVLLLLRVAEDPERTGDAIICGITLAVASASPQYTVYLSGIALVSGIYVLRRRGLRALPALAIAAATYAVLSLYWLLPTSYLALAGRINPGYVLTWTQTELFSRNATVLNVLTGLSQWLVWWHYPAWWNPTWSAAWNAARSLLPLGAALLAVLYWRKSRGMRWLTIATVVVAVMAMGSRSPAAAAYRWVEFRAPGLDAIGWFFRDPGKIEGFVWFGVLLLALGGFLLAYRDATSVMNMRVLAACAACAVTSGILSFLPADLYGYDFAYQPVSPPTYYSQVSRYLHSSRRPTLWVAGYEGAPTFGAGTIEYTWDRGRQGPFFAAESMPGTTFGYYHYTDPFSQEYNYLFYDAHDLGTKLQMLGIGYVVVANDIVGGSASYDSWLRRLSTSASVSLAATFGPLKVFRVRMPAPTAHQRPVVWLGGRAGQDLGFQAGVLDGSSTVFFAQQGTRILSDLTAGRMDGWPIATVDRNPLLTIASSAALARLGVGLSSSATSASIYSGWQWLRMSQSTAAYDGWHAFVSGFLRVPDTWSFGFGLGAAISRSGPASLQIPDHLGPGNYVVLARALLCRTCGTFAMTLGAWTGYYQTTAPSTQMHTFISGPIRVTQSTSSVTLMRGRGTAVINAFAIVPAPTWTRYLAAAKSLLEQNGLTAIYTCSYLQSVRGLELPPGKYSVRGWGGALGVLRVGGQETMIQPGGPTQAMAVSTGQYMWLDSSPRNSCAGGILVSSQARAAPAAFTVVREAYDPNWIVVGRPGGLASALVPVDGSELAALGRLQPGTFVDYQPNLLLQASTEATVVAGLGWVCLLLLLRSRRRRRKNEQKVGPSARRGGFAGGGSEPGDPLDMQD